MKVFQEGQACLKISKISFGGRYDERWMQRKDGYGYKW